MARRFAMTIGEFTGFRTFRKSCDGKIRYPSREAANDAIKRLKASPLGYDVDRLNAYRCHDVDGEHWHVGHSRRKRKDKTS